MAERGVFALERNTNWKGGRTLASSGYVLVKRPGHPMADSRGYVYEHRLLAAETLGRPLLTTEQVHHRDGDRMNNSPENLEVVESLPIHRVRHRRRSDLRLPGQDNPVIRCACGCGETLPKFDTQRRPRKYLPSHNLRTRDAHGWACNREVVTNG